jgi:hypothetical protein
LREKAKLKPERGDSLVTYLEIFPLLWADVADKNCFICGNSVEFHGDVDPYAIGFHRVDGNSDNGYEVCHLDCCKR